MDQYHVLKIGRCFYRGQGNRGHDRCNSGQIDTFPAGIIRGAVGVGGGDDLGDTDDFFVFLRMIELPEVLLLLATFRA